MVEDNRRWASALLLALVIEVSFYLLHYIVAHAILTYLTALSSGDLRCWSLWCGVEVLWEHN